MQNSSPFDFLRSRPFQLLTCLFVLQGAVFYGLSRGESVPVVQPLAGFPARIGEWNLVQEGVVDKETQEMLRADDLLTRSYVKAGTREFTTLFIAFFRSQRAGQTPHSPKNCLPGSGWVQYSSETISVPVPGVPAPIEANRYVVAKGNEKTVTVYWYQSRDRTVASEYRARFFVALDALRYNRTDTALIRVMAPVENDNVDAAAARAISFTQAFFLTLKQFLPS
jgi:EpsI family protein